MRTKEEIKTNKLDELYSLAIRLINEVILSNDISEDTEISFFSDYYDSCGNKNDHNMNENYMCEQGKKLYALNWSKAHMPAQKEDDLYAFCLGYAITDFCNDLTEILKGYEYGYMEI